METTNSSTNVLVTLFSAVVAMALAALVVIAGAAFRALLMLILWQLLIVPSTELPMLDWKVFVGILFIAGMLMPIRKVKAGVGIDGEAISKWLLGCILIIAVAYIIAKFL